MLNLYILEKVVKFSTLVKLSNTDFENLSVEYI